MVFIHYLFHRLFFYNYSGLHLCLKILECVKLTVLSFKCLYLLSFKWPVASPHVFCVLLNNNLYNNLSSFVIG